MTDKKKSRSPIGIVIGTVVFLLLFFIAALVTWTLGYWHDITFDEIVFYLSSPLEGTAGNVITAFIFKVAVPTVLAAVIFAVLSAVLSAALLVPFAPIEKLFSLPAGSGNSSAPQPFPSR